MRRGRTCREDPMDDRIPCSHFLERLMLRSPRNHSDQNFQKEEFLQFEHSIQLPILKQGNARQGKAVRFLSLLATPERLPT